MAIVRDQPQIMLRVLRSFLTCVLIILITWYYQIPERAWALISVWVVTIEYNTIGGVITKSLVRLYGTLLSAVYATVIIYFFGNNALINILAILPGAYFFAYYFLDRENAYIGIIGVVTLSMVLVNYYQIDLALLRLFNVCIGILASILMICIFYPQYARDQLVKAQSQFVNAFSHILENYLDVSKSVEKAKEDYLNYEQDMIQNFASFKRIILEAKIETQKTPLYIEYHTSAHTHVRHIFRLLSVYMSYLSTEQLNVNPKVRHHIQLLQESLYVIQKKLQLSDSEAIAIEVGSFDNEKGKVPEDLANGAFIDILFRSINNEIIQLNEDLTKMLSLYWQYYYRP